jgi:hypothetical protein
MRQQAGLGLQEAGIGFQRKSMQFGQFIGAATAGAGASGFQKTGSLDAYLGQLSSTLKANLTWDQFRAQKTASLQLQGAQITEDTGQATAVSDILGGVSSAAGGLATAGAATKWFGAGTGGP